KPSRDQPFQFAAHVVSGNGHVPARTAVAEENEPELAADDLLVALERLPRALTVDAHRCRTEHLLHLADVPSGQAEGSEQPERDRPAVCDALVAGGGLERVREGMAEVEDLPLAPVVRVAETDARLEGGATPHQLVVGPLTEGLADEQPGLH